MGGNILVGIVVTGTIILVYSLWAIGIYDMIVAAKEKKRLRGLKFEEIYQEKERTTGTHLGVRDSEVGKVLVTEYEDVKIIEKLFNSEVIDDKEKAGTYEKITYVIIDEKMKKTKERDTEEAYLIYVW